MKNFLVLVVAFAFVMFVNSCKKDNVTAVDCSSVVASTNTYTLAVKSILDANCANRGCHDAGTASSGVALDSYANSKSAFQNKNVICSIQHNSGCRPMPEGAAALPDSSIKSLACWASNNYPQ